MVESAPDLPNTGAGVTGATGVEATGALAPPDEPKLHVLLFSIVFLLACVAGAFAIALVPIGGMF
ncbi:hypothetical protein [Sphingomonas sp. PAMC 26621]|uniref:hypothetical protein n=1 Tax=Sphingomonas sp. PAMC 26621 TaxID=1112213 RepID=UPI0002898B36|nr:hypothetical protein [Sphingomonas sp. PAMC 26621]